MRATGINHVSIHAPRPQGVGATPSPTYHHIGLTVDDFASLYVTAGNLVEVDWPMPERSTGRSSPISQSSRI